MVCETEKPKLAGCFWKRRLIRVDLPTPEGPENARGRGGVLVGAMVEKRVRVGGTVCRWMVVLITEADRNMEREVSMQGPDSERLPRRWTGLLELCTAPFISQKMIGDDNYPVGFCFRGPVSPVLSGIPTLAEHQYCC